MLVLGFCHSSHICRRKKKQKKNTLKSREKNARVYDRPNFSESVPRFSFAISTGGNSRAPWVNGVSPRVNILNSVTVSKWNVSQGASEPWMMCWNESVDRRSNLAKNQDAFAFSLYNENHPTSRAFERKHWVKLIPLSVTDAWSCRSRKPRIFQVDEIRGRVLFALLVRR